MPKFLGADRNQLALMPYDIEDRLPTNQLAQFIVEIVSMLYFKEIYKPNKGVGSTAYYPRMLSSDFIVRLADKSPILYYIFILPSILSITQLR